MGKEEVIQLFPWLATRGRQCFHLVHINDIYGAFTASFANRGMPMVFWMQKMLQNMYQIVHHLLVVDIVLVDTFQVATTHYFNSNPLLTFSCTQCAAWVKNSLFFANFHKSKVNAGDMHGQFSSVFDCSTPKFYNCVIYIVAPAKLPIKKVK